MSSSGLGPSKRSFQPIVNWWFGARWFGYLGFPCERDRYLMVPHRIPNHRASNHQFTISWLFYHEKNTCELIRLIQWWRCRFFGRPCIRSRIIQQPFLVAVLDVFFGNTMCKLDTPQKTNKASENRSPQKEFHLPNNRFSGAMFQWVHAMIIWVNVCECKWNECDLYNKKESCKMPFVGRLSPILSQV